MTPEHTITAIHILGQIILGGYFVYQGILHFEKHTDYTAYAAMNRIPMPGIAVYGSGILLLLGGLGIFFNMYTTIAIILLIIFLIPVSFTMHAFWKSPNPAEKAAQQIAFLKNMAILGALLMLF